LSGGHGPALRHNLHRFLGEYLDGHADHTGSRNRSLKPRRCGD
jgi:hypothetical protein